MTPEQLEDLQRMVALRLSLDETAELSWQEWAVRLQRRLAVVRMWTVENDRPTFASVLALAADAMALLHFVDRAELVDPASEAA